MAHRGIDAQPLGIVDIFITCQAAVDRLPQQRRQTVLLVAPHADVVQRIEGHFCQAELVVQFAVGQQPGVSRDLAAQEFQLQAAVKTDPQILVLAVTHRVPLSAWHELAEYPCFSRVWRKSHAMPAGFIWEMRANGNLGAFRDAKTTSKLGEPAGRGDRLVGPDAAVGAVRASDRRRGCGFGVGNGRAATSVGGRERAQEAIEQSFEAYRKGEAVGPEEQYVWSHRLLDLQLAKDEAPDRQFAAAEAHALRMKKLKEIAEALAKSGAGPKKSIAMTDFYCAEAAGFVADARFQQFLAANQYDDYDRFRLQWQETIVEGQAGGAHSEYDRIWRLVADQNKLYTEERGEAGPSFSGARK